MSGKALAAGSSDVVSGKALAAGSSDALEAKQPKRPDQVPDVSPQTQTSGRKRGGGGKPTSTAAATPAPEQPLPLQPLQIVIPGQTVGPLVGADLLATSYTEPVAGKGRIGDAQWQQVLKQVVFPPPSPLEVEQILSQQINGQTWQERFHGLSKLISNPEQLMAEMTNGFSQGEPIEKLRQRIQPLVDGVQASARRIARTEGMRVAETVQRMGWEDLGDMMLGVQLLAVLDQNTRPEHAARNGRIFYKSAADGSPTIDQLPNLPDAPNCRCWSTPVLKPPDEFDKDPAVQAAFANDQGSGIPDPSTYDQWFAGADDTRRKMAVGVRRYNSMSAVLGATRQPEWTDFIDPEGALLPVYQLKAESAWDRSLRKAGVQQSIDQRRQLLQDVSRRGFVVPQMPPQPQPSRLDLPIRPLLTGPSAPPPGQPEPAPKPTAPTLPGVRSIPAATVDDAQAWALQNIPGLKHVDYSGMEVGVANAINAAASQIATKVGIEVPKIGDGKDLGHGHEKSKAPMAASDKGISLRKKYWDGSQAAKDLIDWLENANDDNPHKAGCSRDAYSYAAHEMAHVLHGRSSQRWELRKIVDRYRRKVGQQGIKDELGVYAWDDEGRIKSKDRHKETWAEAFSAYWSDKASCSQATIDMVEEVLRKLYPGVTLP